MLLFLLFVVIDLEVLITAVIMQIFNSIAELVIPIGIPTKEEKAEMEKHEVTVQVKISKCSV